jgi:hypothetical protein
MSQPRPRRASVRVGGSDRGHLPDGFAAQDPHAVEVAIAQHHAAITGGVGGGGKQTGVPGDTAHPAGGGIMHHPEVSVRVQWLGRPGKGVRRLAEAGVGHAEGPVEVVPQNAEELAADPPTSSPSRMIHVAVPKARPAR